MALVYVRFRDPVIHPRTGGAEPVLRALGGDGSPDCVFTWEGDWLVVTAASGGRWKTRTPLHNVVHESHESDEVVTERDKAAAVKAKQEADAKAAELAALAPVDTDTSDALAPLGKAFRK